MRRGTYLNVILTVNAVLLGGLVWTQVASRPLFATEAVAQTRSRPSRNTGIPNAASQRERMIKALNGMKQSIDATRSAIEGGKFKVEVTNLSEMTAMQSEPAQRWHPQR